jgi:hypothetical protein
METESTPPPSRWLLPLALGALGTYVLLGALALGELASARWGFWLSAGTGVCFLLAAGLAVRHLQHP